MIESPSDIAAKFLLELGRQTSLFTQFVGRDPVQPTVPFYWNYFDAVCENCMVGALAKEPKTAVFQVSDKITPIDRHA